MSDFRGKVRIVAALAAVVVLTLGTMASAERPVFVSGGSLELVFNGGFLPKSAPRNVPTPVALSFSAEVRALDETDPPPLRELVYKLDRNLGISTEGLPVCKLRARYQDTQEAERDCGGAIAGQGFMNVGLEHPAPGPVAGHNNRLVIFNGGVRRGVTTLYGYVKTGLPIPTAIVSTIKIIPIDEGRFGSKLTMTIPRIAGGEGFITEFFVTLDREFSRHGEKTAVSTLTCPDHKIRTDAIASFADGTALRARLSRPCIPRS